jgi:hypothetical protein
MEKEIEKYKKVLQYYLDSVLNPKIENFGSNPEEPTKVSIHRVYYSENFPNRLTFFLDIDPELLSDKKMKSITDDLKGFYRMLGEEKKIHIYWNKRGLF